MMIVSTTHFSARHGTTPLLITAPKLQMQCSYQRSMCTFKLSFPGKQALKYCINFTPNSTIEIRMHTAVCKMKVSQPEF